MNWREEIGGAVLYTLIVLATIISFGAIFVVIHEFIHSTTAYLMGHLYSPLGIEWGNPLTLDSWDEGVSYSAMFNAGQGIDAAVIAVGPLFLHACIVTGGLYLLLSGAILQRKWLLHLIFWLVIVNLMELVAYMPVRAFSLHGDIGNINHGLGLNPWLLFFVGTILILAGLYFLFRHVLPRMYTIVARESRLVRYVILVFSTFYLFIFRGSISNALHYSPDMQWVRALWVCGICGGPVFLQAWYPLGHQCREAVRERNRQRRPRPCVRSYSAELIIKYPCFSVPGALQG